MRQRAAISRFHAYWNEYKRLDTLQAMFTSWQTGLLLQKRLRVLEMAAEKFKHGRPTALQLQRPFRRWKRRCFLRRRQRICNQTVQRVVLKHKLKHWVHMLQAKRKRRQLRVSYKQVCQVRKQRLLREAWCTLQTKLGKRRVLRVQRKVALQFRRLQLSQRVVPVALARWREALTFRRKQWRQATVFDARNTRSSYFRKWESLQARNIAQRQAEAVRKQQLAQQQVEQLQVTTQLKARYEELSSFQQLLNSGFLAEPPGEPQPPSTSLYYY
jgi:hypothetical protein